ncbi:hypothetical protein [Pseudoalteromonas xiamenensis]|uniref:hypothetical protein n=1 Tax=Pseudoalteromonas xiamenensis TaxID=882626 RepID=UPI0031378F9C
MKLSVMTLALIPGLLLSASSFAAERIDRQIDVPVDGKIIIENDRGDVVIKAWDKASFKVTGELDESRQRVSFGNQWQRDRVYSQHTT